MKNRHSAQNQLPKTSESESDSLNPLLLELVRLRVAQMHQNQAFMEEHRQELISKGETQKRLEELETWGTSTLFDKTERTALALCEKITLNSSTPPLECFIRETRNYFTKGEIVRLTLAIIAVNDWYFLK